MRKIDKKYYSISFDRFSRQSRAYDVIESLRQQGKKFTILDVGGYRGLTSELHKQDDVTILDVYDVDEQGYVQGDGLNMQFKDASFDFVVSFDVLEHIPTKDRERFVEECCRVANIGVIIAAPIRTNANELAELNLNDLHKRLYKIDHEWLKEHIEYTIPTPGQAETVMRKKGLETTVLGSNDIVSWTLMQGAVFLNAKFTEGEKTLGKLNNLYNETAYNDGTANPLESYRHIVCGFKHIDDTKKVKAYLERNSRPISVEEKVKIAHNITQHYTDTLYAYTRLYEKLYTLFETKVKENDELIGKINSIESSKKYKVLKKLAKIKSALKERS